MIDLWIDSIKTYSECVLHFIAHTQWLSNLILSEDQMIKSMETQKKEFLWWSKFPHI